MKPIMEFAKIVVASNGQQVLFYFEPEDAHEGDAMFGTLHMMALFDEALADSTLRINMEHLEKKFSKLGTKQADSFLGKLKDLLGE